MKSKRRVETQVENESAKDTTKVRLSKNIQARRRAIRKKRIRRTDRKEALEKKKGPNGAKRRRGNRKKRNMNRLIIALESLRPADMNKKARAPKSDVTPTKMPERVKRRRRRGGQIRNTEHSQKGKREGSSI
jgi:hypothetical protein